MKFIFFNHDGQAISGVHSYGQLLHAAHPDCVLLSLNDGTDPPNATIDGRHFRLPFDLSHDTATIAELLGEIARRYPDDEFVLLPNNGTVPLLACLQALRDNPDLRRRARILAIVHSDHPDAYALFVEYERYIAHFAGVSRQITANLSKALPHRRDVISFLPYPVQIPTLAPEKVQTNETPLRLVYVGRLEERQKRVHRLPAVAAALARQGVPFSLDLYGDGPARKTLEETINQLLPDIRRQIRLHGAVDGPTLRECILECDVVLLVSAYEGTPIALLEGMAAGLCPVVMEIDSGIPELIRDGLDGFRIPQGDVEVMATALSQLHHDRQKLAYLKQNARRIVAEEYSVGRHIERLRHIFRACLFAPEATVGCFKRAFGHAIQQILTGARPDVITAIWGGGMFGRALTDACLIAGIQPSAIIESDPEKHGWHYRGIPYLAPTDLPHSGTVQVLIGSLAFKCEITQHIRTIYSSRGLPCPRLSYASERVE